MYSDLSAEVHDVVVPVPLHLRRLPGYFRPEHRELSAFFHPDPPLPMKKTGGKLRRVLPRCARAIPIVGQDKYIRLREYRKVKDGEGA